MARNTEIFREEGFLKGLLFLSQIQCGLALHRKCMEVCQLECEHNKGTVFGVDLSMLLQDSADDVPFVLRRCTSEIENRALSVQVSFTARKAKIYPVSGQV